MSFILEGLISDIRYVDLGIGRHCEVKVDVDGRETAWLGVKNIVTKHFKQFTPPAIDDQAFVHNPNGSDNETAYVEIGVAYEFVSLPKDINENTVAFFTSDGTKYIHNLKAKEVSLATPCDIKITAPKVTLDAMVEVTKDLKVLGTIDDKKGTVTNHEHVVVNHSKAKKR